MVLGPNEFGHGTVIATRWPHRVVEVVEHLRRLGRELQIAESEAHQLILGRLVARRWRFGHVHMIIGEPCA